jgi:hypothetical protein
VFFVHCCENAIGHVASAIWILIVRSDGPRVVETLFLVLEMFYNPKSIAVGACSYEMSSQLKPTPKDEKPALT